MNQLSEFEKDLALRHARREADERLAVIARSEVIDSDTLLATIPTTGQHVKVLIGLYKDCTAKVVSTERIAPDKHSVLLAFGSGYRVRYWDTEVQVIHDI